MTEPTNPPTTMAVRHNAAASRFEATVDGRLCVASYRRSPGVVDLYHTGVPQALEGRGIAAALVGAALAWAAAEGLAVRASCAYVRVYLRRHPELSVRQVD